MFLINNLNSITTWIENNPNSAKLFFDVIKWVSGGILALLSGWVLLNIIFNRKKRVEAKATLYPRINEKIEQLKNALNEHDRLNVSDFDKGNIYTLKYLSSKRRQFCPAFNEIENSELNAYKEIASTLDKLLNNSENNIHPKALEKKKWRNARITINEFCCFLKQIDDYYCGDYGLEPKSGESPMHITMCLKLINALEYILKNT